MMNKSSVALGLLAAVLGCAVFALARRGDRLLDLIDAWEKTVARKERLSLPRPEPEVPVLVARTPEIYTVAPASAPPSTEVASSSPTSTGAAYSTKSGSIEVGPEVENGGPFGFGDRDGFIELPFISAPFHYPDSLESQLGLSASQWQYIEGLQKARNEEVHQARERYELLMKQSLDSLQLAKYGEMKKPGNRFTFVTTARYWSRVVDAATGALLATAGEPAPR